MPVDAIIRTCEAGKDGSRVGVEETGAEVSPRRLIRGIDRETS